MHILHRATKDVSKMSAKPNDFPFGEQLGVELDPTTHSAGLSIEDQRDVISQLGGFGMDLARRDQNVEEGTPILVPLQL
jgi:hypothetical protein